ncbi:MAG: glycosyltransferase family protein [Phycisphaerae bacterium]
MELRHTDNSQSRRPKGRVFAYCHDGVGLGHLSRTVTICERLTEAYPFATCLIATGSPYASLFRSLARTDHIKLPALEKVDAQTYRGKHLALPADRIIRCREIILRHAIEQFDPDVVLVDKAPLGVCGELIPALEWLRANRPDTRVIFGMRDIEDAPQTTIDQWTSSGVMDGLATCFDEIWVYGSRDVMDVVKEYELSPRIASKLRYMGYVTPPPCDGSECETRTGGNVLVTVGGGTDGQFLLETYLQGAAQRLAERGVGSTIVGGPDLPEPVAKRLRAIAAEIDGVEWVDFDRCMDCTIRSASLVVSMGGYNTVCQIVRNGKPALIIPRTKPRLEQAMRARRWARRGLVEYVAPDGLTAERLADRILDTLQAPASVDRIRLDFDGLDRITARLDAIWGIERATNIYDKQPALEPVSNPLHSTTASEWHRPPTGEACPPPAVCEDLAHGVAA